MLRSFEVSNHKSFRCEQELQLMSAKNRAQPAVPVAAIYGANASGKSNLLGALRFMQRAVVESFRLWESGSGVPRSPYALDVAGRVEPSSFVVEVVLDDVEFLYGFIVDDERVREEWLYSYPRGKKRVIFERTGSAVTLGSTLAEPATRTELVERLLRENSLVLSASAQTSAMPELDAIQRWFRTGLRVVSRSHFETTSVRLARRVESALARHPQLIELVRVADMGLTGIRVDVTTDSPDQRTLVMRTSIELEIEQVQAQIVAKAGHSEPLLARLLQLRAIRDGRFGPQQRYDLVFLHGEDALPMSAEDQSDGTLNWLNLLPLTLDTLADGGVLVVDELDASLHSRLVARLIELFRDERTNDRGAQLIFTTHDATLLGTSFGREVLARDEIWLVEKDSHNRSKLVALTDFHPRKEDNRERRYLGGSYGGVPAIYSDTFVETLVAARAKDDNAQA